MNKDSETPYLSHHGNHGYKAGAMTLSAVAMFGICVFRGTYLEKGVWSLKALMQEFEAEYLISHSLDLCL